MKRFLFTITLMFALALFIQPVRYLVGDILGLEQPITHQVEKGNWLSKLAAKHYGDASYWKELALVNRAPNPDLIFPEEEVIVPSLAAIKKIRNARSLSSVNSVLDEQEAIIAARSESRQEAVTTEQGQESMANSEEPVLGAGQKEPLSDAPEERRSQDVAKTRPENEPATYPLPEEYENAADGEDTGSFLSSTPAITGLVILGVVALLGVLMAVRSRKRSAEAEQAPYDSSLQKEEHDDSSWKQRFSGQHKTEERSGNGSRSRKREKEELEVK